MGAGGLLALVHAFFAIHLRADQIVGGTAINFLALGITGYLFIDIYGSNGTPNLTDAQSIPDVAISRSGNVLRAGVRRPQPDDLDLVRRWSSSTYLRRLPDAARPAHPLGGRASARRRHGRHLRLQDPLRGRDLLRACSSAMGGAYLSIGFVHSFNENMTEGRGFIALAALIFGNWRPFGAFGAALLFGFSSALAQRLGTIPNWSSYAVLFQALPYVLTLIAVAGVIGRSIPPAADGQPYQKQ